MNIKGNNRCVVYICKQGRYSNAATFIVSIDTSPPPDNSVYGSVVIFDEIVEKCLWFR
jgi:hypothetical protein